MDYVTVGRPQSVYIATAFQNGAEARALGERLTGQFGLGWFQGHNWTDLKHPTPLDHPAARDLAVGDLQAAAYADIFVKILTARPSPGAFAELGGRLALGRVAHVIENGHKMHLLHCHPLVRRYRDVEHFCTRLECYFERRNRYVWPEDDVKQSIGSYYF